MEQNSDLGENIKACRTCGIHYVTPSKDQLKHLFQSSMENPEIMLIRLELAQWSIEVAENDGFPQYVCNTCINKFKQVFALRAACITARNDFHKFYAVPNGNTSNVKIKTELPDPDEQQMCDFVYVDDLSDGEYDGATPFNFPHAPIKEEVIEAATIPIEDPGQPTNIVEAALGAALHIEPSSSHISRLQLQSENLTARHPSVVVKPSTEEIGCHLFQHVSLNHEEYKQNLQLTHETNDFNCHICGKEFKNSTQARLKFHLKWHTLNKQLKCSLCGFTCNSKYALREHKRLNHRKLNCPICHKVVLAKKMKLHLKQHEQLAKYPCEYCAEVFNTEDNRENHIWQIHANEDNNNIPNLIPIFETTCTKQYTRAQEENTSLQESQENTPYKFFCAHCKYGFIEQIDLETHVNEYHSEESYPAFLADQVLNDTSEITTQHAQDINGNANIKVFEGYDNDNEMYPPHNNTLTLRNTSLLVPSTSDFLTESENIQIIENETESNDSSDTAYIAADVEDETVYNMSSYVASDLNTFACAKCSDTFAAIEQLRQHHDQHLAAEQQAQQQFDSIAVSTAKKSIFQCNLCDKSFNLKFVLNRHIKKHKHAANF